MLYSKLKEKMPDILRLYHEFRTYHNLWSLAMMSDPSIKILFTYILFLTKLQKKANPRKRICSFWKLQICNVRHISGFWDGWYPGSPTSDQRFWQFRFSWGRLNISQLVLTPHWDHSRLFEKLKLMNSSQKEDSYD